MKEMLNSNRVITVLLLVFIFCSCRFNKRTRVGFGATQITFTEKYIIRNDSIFPIKRIKKNIVISFSDTTYGKGYISFSQYRKGKLNGTQYIYRGDGEIVFYGEYKNGQKNGFFLRFINNQVHRYAIYKFDENINEGVQLKIPFD